MGEAKVIWSIATAIAGGMTCYTEATSAQFQTCRYRSGYDHDPDARSAMSVRGCEGLPRGQPAFKLISQLAVSEVELFDSWIDSNENTYRRLLIAGRSAGLAIK